MPRNCRSRRANRKDPKTSTTPNAPFWTAAVGDIPKRYGDGLHHAAGRSPGRTEAIPTVLSPRSTLPPASAGSRAGA